MFFIGTAMECYGLFDPVHPDRIIIAKVFDLLTEVIGSFLSMLMIFKMAIPSEVMDEGSEESVLGEVLVGILWKEAWTVWDILAQDVDPEHHPGNVGDTVVVGSYQVSFCK